MAKLINHKRIKKRTDIIIAIVFACLAGGIWGIKTQAIIFRPVPTEVEIQHLFSNTEDDYYAIFHPTTNPEVTFKGKLTKLEFDSLNPGSKTIRELSPMSVKGYGAWKVVVDLIQVGCCIIAIIFLTRILLSITR